MTNRMPTPPEARKVIAALIRISMSTSPWQSTAGGSVSAIKRSSLTRAATRR